MTEQKLAFLQSAYIPLTLQLTENSAAKWGKMNAQQMVEHVADFFKVSTGEIVFPLLTPLEHLPKYKAFLLSDKEFRENTQAPLDVLPSEPLSTRCPNLEDAIAKLQRSISNFIKHFETDPHAQTVHPVFGVLNYEEWVLLHYKHVLHHAKQFGLVV